MASVKAASAAHPCHAKYISGLQYTNTIMKNAFPDDGCMATNGVVHPVSQSVDNPPGKSEYIHI